MSTYDLLIAAIDALLAFALKHAKGPLDPSGLLTQDQIEELTNLDTELYAQCQVSGLSLLVIPEPQGEGVCRFGNSKLPYVLATVHLPIKNEDGTITREMRGSGLMLIVTPEWIHALKSLRATAVALKAKEDAKTRSTPTPTATPAAQGASLESTSGGDRRAGTKRKQPRRGRPVGSKTETPDRELYLQWKAAYESNRITKKEFLREMGLPESDFYAIERGRKQEKKRLGRGKVAGNNSVKPV